MLVDVDSGKPVARLNNAHAVPLSTLTCNAPQTFCTAADSGEIKLWDTRLADAFCVQQAHTDFVADLTMEERRQCLLSVSGDGTLCVLDLRTNKVCEPRTTST